MCNAVGAVFSAISTAFSVVGYFQQQRNLRQQQNYEQMAYEMQRRQEEENAKQAMLAMQQKINDRKRDYLRNMKSNKVALAAGNVDLDSPSFGAFFKASKKTAKQDIRRLQVNGHADVVSSQRAAQQTRMAAQASAQGFKARQTAARYGMYGNLARAGGDLVRAAQGAKGSFFTS